ncbi:MAG: hypothetical protein JW726_00060 [Anaerolineales bacterium]|nr:hypothetical protein [Anaerolineales bacterium]
MSAHAPVTHVLPLTTIRRERLLPVQGKLIARRGQRVNPSDVIAEAVLKPEHLLLDIGRGLGLPAEQADEYIQRKPGEEVGEGDILAGPVGAGRRTVRSPHSGIVVLAGEGQILLQLADQPFELRAGYSGTVVELILDRGVIIETVGALIQGVWGNDRINYGLLHVLAESPEHEVTTSQLDVSQRGSVIFAGYCQDANVLTAAADLPLRGVILSSMDSALVATAKQVDIPVVVLDGFGRLPMNPRAHKLLSTSGRREVALNAEHWDRYANTRPELVIALPSQGQPVIASDTATYTVGQSVRVTSAPYMARPATITRLLGIVAVPSGVRTSASEVRFENGEIALVPLVNLEILE